MLTQPLTQCQAVRVRQQHIDDDRVRPFDAGDSESCFATRRGDDVDFVLQDERVEIEVRQVVFDQQDQRAGSSSSPANVVPESELRPSSD